MTNEHAEQVKEIVAGIFRKLYENRRMLHDYMTGNPTELLKKIYAINGSVIRSVERLETYLNLIEQEGNNAPAAPQIETMQDRIDRIRNLQNKNETNCKEIDELCDGIMEELTCPRCHDNEHLRLNFYKTYNNIECLTCRLEIPMSRTIEQAIDRWKKVTAALEGEWEEERKEEQEEEQSEKKEVESNDAV